MMMNTSERKKRAAWSVLVLLAAYCVCPLGVASARAETLPAAAAAPQQSSPAVSMAISTDSYWYKPGDTVKLAVTLDNGTRRTMNAISVRARIHVPNTSRADLDLSFEGKPRKSYRQTETFSPLTLEPGNNKFTFKIVLKSDNYSAGVYPVTIDVLRSGNIVTSVITELVVMEPTSDQGSITPLKLSWVFDTLEPSHRDVEGDFKSDELARECDPSGKNPGWYPTLLSEMDKWPSLAFNLSVSPMLLEDIKAMSGGYVVRRGDHTQGVGANSVQAGNASEVLMGFKGLLQSPRYQVLPEPYASPNLETLVSLKWSNDARDQISRGHKLLEETLDAALSNEFNCPPALLSNTQVLNELGTDVGQFLVLSPDLLERSSQGKRLLRGSTLTSPVLLKGGPGNRKELALFADARMQKLLARLSASGDPHGVAQIILAELTNLYLEKPGANRAVVVVAPGSWHPSKDVLDEVFRAMSSAPWLKSVTLAENIMTVPTVNSTALEIPGPQTSGELSEYFKKVGTARDKYASYHDIVLTGNPFLVPLLRDVYTSESDVWREWARNGEGLRYASFVSQTVTGELDKVTMPVNGSITLTSSKAKIPLSVVNGTGYRIKAELKCSSNGLVITTRSQKVLLEPKENLFEVPVKVRTKGRVRFSARLVAGNFILGELDFSVRTSRFNTFAILLVGGLLALIGITWSARYMSRRKAGKHRQFQVKTPDNEEPAPEA